MAQEAKAQEEEAKAAAEAARRAEAEEGSRQLEAETREVRRLAEREIHALSERTKAVEAGRRRLRREAEENSALRVRLWEAEVELQALRDRAQGLEAARSKAKRRAEQRMDEERQLASDIEYLQAEAKGYRACVREFQAVQQQEEELRRSLHQAKAALRAARSGACAPKEDGGARGKALAAHGRGGDGASGGGCCGAAPSPGPAPLLGALPTPARARRAAARG